MKLVCSQGDLSSKLSLLSRVVPNNPSHPVLANVLVTAEAERLGLSVFDLSLGMQVWLSATVEAPGAITLPARFLNDIISRLPNSEVEVEIDALNATLTCGMGHYQMQGLSAEEFPSLPTLNDVEPIQIPAEVLLDGLQTTLFSASADESKQILTGLHLARSVDGLEFAATDGHRLAVCSFPETVAEAEMDLTIPEQGLTIPAKALRELERMLSRIGSTVAIRFDLTQIAFEFEADQGTERLNCRLLEGQYPTYRQLIPTEFSRQVTINRQALLSGVERIAVLAARKNNIIRLKVDAEEQRVALSAEAPEFGTGEECIPAQISGESIEIAFNVKYLGDGLKAMDAQEIQLQLNEETLPAIISPLSGRKVIYLIMPIQVR